MAVSLFVAGDVVPKGVNPALFAEEGRRIFSEMSSFITGSDFSIVNLEAPIIKGNLSPIRKDGPCLGIDPSVVSVLRQVGFDIVTLANNHFFDQGQKGVENTINECYSHNVKFVGGGINLSQTRTPLLLEHEGKRIAIINACEHEFSIADNTHGGSNPLDLINMQKDIVTARSQSDYVILILHGGIELYHYPTPRMKRWYRHFIDLGADAIVNHHQHCINGFEIYKDKPIFYGLGNFYFPSGGQHRPESWEYGYAVRLFLGERIEYELIPYKQSTSAITLRDIKDFEKEIELLNIPIHNDFLLQQKFDERAINIENYLKLQLLPSFLRGRFISFLICRGLLGKLYTGRALLSTRNKLTCESHKEAITRLFEIMA